MGGGLICGLNFGGPKGVKPKRGARFSASKGRWSQETTVVQAGFVTQTKSFIRESGGKLTTSKAVFRQGRRTIGFRVRQQVSEGCQRLRRQHWKLAGGLDGELPRCSLAGG